MLAETHIATGLPFNVNLFVDRPDKATAEATETAARWVRDEIDIPRFLILGSLVHVDLYEGHGSRANERLLADWRMLSRSLLMRTPIVGIRALDLRARCALALYDGLDRHDTKLATAALRAAGSAARRLDRRAVPWSIALAAAIRAQLASFRADRATTIAKWGLAVRAFDEADMALHGQAARMRHGEALGDKGAATRETAATWFDDRGAIAPTKLVRLLMPAAGDRRNT